MEIILKKDIEFVGYKDDLVTVKNGFARNFLFPKGLAVLATDSAKKVRAENLKQRAHKEEKLVKEAEALAETLKSVTLKLGAKVGTSGKIFGSVNAIQLAEAIKEKHNIEIDRKKIKMNSDAIKEVGTYVAKLDLHKGVKIDIEFEVVGE